MTNRGRFFRNTLNAEQSEKIKSIVQSKVGQKLGEYSLSKQFTLDILAQKVDKQGRQIALKEVNRLANLFSPKILKYEKDKYKFDEGFEDRELKKFKNQFKYFIKTYTNVLDHNKYNWNVIQKQAKEKA
jgi:hypothetical protein